MVKTPTSSPRASVSAVPRHNSMMSYAPNNKAQPFFARYPAWVGTLVKASLVGVAASVVLLVMTVPLWGVDLPSVAVALGVVAVAMAVSFPALQLSRSIKSSAGVSPSSWMILFVCLSSWAAYGISNGDAYQTTIGIVALPITAAVIVLAHRFSPIPARSIVLSLSGAVLLSWGAAVDGVFIPTASLLATSTLIGILSISAALRASDVSGISLPAISAATLAQALWAFHASLEVKPVVLIHAVVVVTLNAVFAAVKIYRTKK